MKRALLLLLIAAGCGKGGDKKSCSVSSVGSCDPGAAQCGYVMTCGDNDTRELRCTAPDGKDCTCVENGVVGKKATLADGVPKLDHKVHAAAAACGWDVDGD